MRTHGRELKGPHHPWGRAPLPPPTERWEPPLLTTGFPSRRRKWGEELKTQDKEPLVKQKQRDLGRKWWWTCSYQIPLIFHCRSKERLLHIDTVSSVETAQHVCNKDLLKSQARDFYTYVTSDKLFKLVL
jgi:hypothetical protein